MARLVLCFKRFVFATKPYLEWSTVSDGPTTHGMDLAEFCQYWKEEYGQKGLRELPILLSHAFANGVSNGEPLDSLLDGNSLGPDGDELSIIDFAKQYCT